MPDMSPLSLPSPIHGLLVQWLVAPGDEVSPGQPVVIIESMKMEHEICAAARGWVTQCCGQAGEGVQVGDVLLILQHKNDMGGAIEAKNTINSSIPPHVTEPMAAQPAAVTAFPPPPAPLRADLQRLINRQAHTLDAHRPAAVAKRHALGQRTARENLADLCDKGSFIEYGALAVAAQRSRRSDDDLMANTPADGMVVGLASVNGELFGPEVSRTAVLAYDATVLAGTQGVRNHQKTDRLLGIALAHKRPVVLFAEGGGGRPGDVDMPIVAGLHVGTFAAFARLNGQVPLVGVVSGRCFAGNAALLGCCDVIIATRRSNIGMGGPAMVEGGGLGVYSADDIGPSAVQSANGVIDVLVDDDAAAVAAARQYLGYFQGRMASWTSPDPLALREAVPALRTRAYDTRTVLRGVVDENSLMELRAGFGAGVHTALGRIEGRPVGLLANNPLHLGGAIDAAAADKAARFMQLCNAHGLPLIQLVDTPGFMVGPETEASAQVRHVSRMFIAAAHLRVPVFSVVLRKGYGLGAMAMCAGGFHAPVFTVAWPTGEFGAMGLEGAVRLGWRKELEAQPDEAAREVLFQQLLARQVEAGSALNMATTLEIDAVIDPADTRHWLVQGLLASGAVGEWRGPVVDAW
jgi:acetyl-CoA carboxylase carboxyltransferase component